jgi:4-hydroxymandelate oxidase
MAGSRARYRQERYMPPGIVTLEDFESLAKQRLSLKTFEGVRGGAADEITVRWNRDGFNRIPLRPRVLVDVSHVGTGLTLFGQRLACPIVLAPAASPGRTSAGCDRLFEFRSC